MPRFNIYIRNEDLVLWEAILDRPEWLHQQLIGGLGKQSISIREVAYNEPVYVDPEEAA